MEVILLKDTEYGDKGNVVKVADGYARNYLFPNGIAVEKNVGNLKHVAQIGAQRKKKLEKEKAEVEKQANKINETAVIVLKAKGGENGAMFGSITHAQLAEEICKATGVDVDRRRVMIRSIKEAGLTEVPVRLTHGITAKAKVKVELEVEKSPESSQKKKKKKEDIRAEIEAKEAEAAVVPEVEVKAEDAAPVKEKKEKKTKAKKADK